MCKGTFLYLLIFLYLLAFNISCSAELSMNFYAPNFGEVEGAYWFGPGRPSVCPSVHNSLAAEKLKNRL